MRTAWLFALLLSSAAVAQAADAPIVMLGDGGTYARDTFPRAARWVGLYCEGQRCALRHADVTIDESSALNVVDEAEPTDVVTGGGAPIALFSGLPLAPGDVDTWFIAAPDGGAPFAREHGEWTMPWGRRPLTLAWMPNGDGFEYLHRVSDGIHEQILLATAVEGHYGGDTSMPAIAWAGDLDRDGLIDLLLSLPDDNCGYDQRLYLSSNAAPGELLHLSAQLAGYWPACGC